MSSKKTLTYTVQVKPNGDKYWYLNDKIHREDGPAVEWADGTKFWYLNGKLHREDGPALEYADGTKYWYLNGEFHREDGPALEYANGDKYWYLNDKPLSEAEHAEEMKKRSAPCADKIVEIDGKKYKLVSA